MKKFSQVFELLSASQSEDMNLIKDIMSSLEMSENIDQVKVIPHFNTDIMERQDQWCGYMVKIIFSKLCMSKRGNASGYSFSSDEIIDYWKDIVDNIKTIKSHGFDCSISFYQPNGVEMTMKIFRTE